MTDMKHKPYGIYERFIKRPLDCFIALIALIVLLPLMVGIALLVRVKLGAPIIFSQNRPGRNEKIFKLYKFRTMSNEKNEDGELLPDEVRLTKFGKILRSTSLDELPQLFNIVKGDMSIIGPRALLVDYLPFYSREESKRHLVRPGLTNLVSIMGRNSVTVADKFRYDIEYVKHISFMMDFKIFWGTILIVLNHSGTQLEGENKYYDYFKQRERERFVER